MNKKLFGVVLPLALLFISTSYGVIGELTIPNVMGMTIEEAQNALPSPVYGMNISYSYSDTVPENIVISQSPPPGVITIGPMFPPMPWVTLSLVVSLGPEFITVPTIIGMHHTQASNAVVAAGLTVGGVTSAYSATVAEGNIISQDPSAGTSVSSGSSVNYVVSLGPELVTVPNVIGMSRSAAETAVITVGLSVGTVTHEYNAAVPYGSIVSQDPAPAASLPLGAAVNLVMSLGTPSSGIIYVDDTATGLQNGRDWTNAFKFLQDALAQAQSGDEIHVAAGLYRPDQFLYNSAGTKNDFAGFTLKNQVKILGGFPDGGGVPESRSYLLNMTFLSGDLDGDDGPDFANNTENSHHVILAETVDNSAVLDGFWIYGGNAKGTFGTDPDETGGGMYINQAAPTIINCLFADNYARTGGAVGCDGGNPTFTDCIFVSNSASYGAGLFTDNAGAVLNDCTFVSNTATFGGAVYTIGAADNLICNNCTFEANIASINGGGVMLFNAGVWLTNCVLVGNTSNGTSAGGGGMYLTANFGNRSNATVVNCVFRGNTAANWGGGIYLRATSQVPSECRIYNSTFADNHAVSGKSIACNSDNRQYPGIVEIANSILWETTSPVCNYDGSAITVSSCNVSGGWPGFNNMNVNPLFRNPNGEDGTPGTSDDDLSLQTTSPCIDAGDNTLVPADRTDIDGDLDTTEILSLDILGQPRFNDVPTCLDTGNGTAPIVDMGAYEAVLAVCGDARHPYPIGDLNHDCFVSLPDFVLMCEHWLECTHPEGCRQ